MSELEKSRRWLWLRRALLPLACLLIVGQSVTIPILFTLNSNRAQDIEGLVCSAHREKVKRIAATTEYLGTPLGRQRSGETGGLNSYIVRRSLPQLKVEVAKEREHLPPACLKKKS
jgi:hypothetical protein